MITRILSLLLFFSASFSSNSQDIENGVYSCIKEKYKEKGSDWQLTCDSIIFYMTDGADSITKKMLLQKLNDSTWQKKIPERLISDIQDIYVKRYGKSIVETCFSYFSHRDGHEQKIEGEAGEFMGLVKRKATHEEYITFFNELSEEFFMHPFYKYSFISWVMSAPR
ncbi:MAG: hypothetical protein ACHQF2_02895 [Flavobacteriales bacterium]